MARINKYRGEYDRWDVTCYVLHVTRHVLHVKCHLSHVTCYMSRVLCRWGNRLTRSYLNVRHLLEPEQATRGNRRQRRSVHYMVLS